MRILDDLISAEGFTTFVALTFNLDLAWFEVLLLRSLRSHGIRRVLLFADSAELSATLDRQIQDLSSLGMDYYVHGVRPPGRFHPKAFLLAGPTHARMFVGSGNLTVGGLNRNREVFARWDVEIGDDESPRAFADLRRYVGRLAEEFGIPTIGPIGEALNAAFGCAPLAKPSAQLGPELWGSPGRLVERIAPPSPADSFTILAPFFDDEGALPVRLAELLQVSSFDVITDLAMTTLTRSAVEAICRAGGTCKVVDRSEGSQTTQPTHAKMMFASSDEWKIGIIGSANASNAAWEGINAELVAAYFGDDADAVQARVAELPTRDLTDDDLETLDRHEAARADSESEEDGPALPVPSVARWVDESTIELVFAAAPAAAFSVELRAGASASTMVCTPTGAYHSGENVKLSLSSSDNARLARGSPAVLRLVSGGLAGPWVPVHDEQRLRAAASDRAVSDARTSEFLGADPNDPTTAASFLEFLEELWLDRSDRRQPVSQGGPVRGESGGDEAPNTVWFKQSDFGAPHAGAAIESASTHLDLSPSGLLRRLLFADIGEIDAAPEVSESELTEEAADTGVAPRSARGRSTRHARGLGETAVRLRDAFLSDLRQGGAKSRGPTRLVEDLLVITAALQRGLRTGCLSPLQYLGSELPLVRSIFGDRNAPLPIALSQLGGDAAASLWRDVPFAAVAGLVLYNVALGDLVASGGASPDLVFPDSNPVMWMRNVLRGRPESPLEDFLDQVANQLARFRRTGDLWLTALWPSVSAKVPFDGFVDRIIREADGLVEVERSLLPGWATIPRASLGDDNGVVGIGRDGGLGAGFFEFDERHPMASFGLLHDGAFQMAEPRSNSRYARMHRVAEKGLRSLSACEAALGSHASGQIAVGVDVLRRLTQ